MKKMTNESVNIFWFRRDLRLKDNHALSKALQEKKNVICLFIFDTSILSHLENKTDARVNFIHDTLKEMKAKLQDWGSDLLVMHEKPVEAFEKLIKNFDIESVYSNMDYEPMARKRDHTIYKALKEIPFIQFKDQCIFAQNDVLKKDKTPYTVYTPYKRRWLEAFSADSLYPFPVSKYKKSLLQLEKKTEFISLEEMGFKPSEIKIPKLTFSTKIITEYKDKRDIPSLDATSKLGLHLRFGTVSVRECAKKAYELDETWLSELIWREFFMQILFHFPHVTKKSFRPKYDNIPWINNKTHFKAWCEGKTGYPMVDAGMRELNETGHMHNRVRMVVASFLVKHLLIDWKWGERYFAQRLLDYDLSANNGNWQWAAGTGCDAAPYFRVFNPTLQAKRFDPQSIYIKKWISEFDTDEYPEPIVEHSFASKRAVMTYKSSFS